MTKKFPRWSQDLGFPKAVAPHRPKISPAAFGLKGGLAEGRLSFSRAQTRKVAKTDAEDGLPPSDAATPDQWSEREQEIAAEAEDVRRGLAAWFAAAGSATRDFIIDATPADLSPDQLREAIKTGENELRHHEADDASEAQSQHEESRAELAAFKKKHAGEIGERTPDIKKSIEQTIAVLFGVLILEGAFNALLFKDAQAGGLLGGLLVAFGVSAVNVTFGVAAGFFGFRYLNHAETPFKVLGGVVAAAFVTAGLMLNLFVAHYRDAVESALIAAEATGTLGGFSMFDVAPGAVVAGMFPNVFDLSNMVAFGLLFAGLLVFAIAVYEGYDRISDKYPGYGRVWRKERRAYERRQAVRNGLRDDLADYFSRCRAWFEVQHARHVEAKREVEKAMNWLETQRAQAMAIGARCADQERGLKIAYRQAHRRARNALRDVLGEDAAIPLYFDELVTPDLPALDTGQERELADKAVKAVDLNITALSISREWLETHVQSVQKGLSSIEKKVVAELQAAREAREASDASLDDAPPRKRAAG